MDKQLGTVCEKLETMNSRMTVLEARQKHLEEEIQSSPSCSSSNNSTPASGQQRKRLTPVALQVFYHLVQTSIVRFPLSLEQNTRIEQLV